MKWRKLIELSTSSSPPKASWRIGRTTSRRATFEALENRKLFAADLAEITVAELFSSEAVPGEEVTPETVELMAMKVDESAELAVETLAWDRDAGIEYPEVMMMTFRGGEVFDETAKSEEVSTDYEIDPAILMTMTGAVSDTIDVEMRSLEGDVDLLATSVPMESNVAIDDVISDEDLIFYTMGPGPDLAEVESEVETTSVEDFLLAEDVNGDGSVTALDMLLVFDALNSYGPMPSSQLTALPEVSSVVSWDINRDGYVTPLDALLLTNYFNNSSDDTTESAESILVATAVARMAYPVDDQFAADEPVDESVPLIEDDSADDFWARV